MNSNRDSIDDIQKSAAAAPYRAKYKGVYKCGHKWKAQLQNSGVQYYLGVYNNEEEAKRIYDLKYKEIKENASNKREPALALSNNDKTKPKNSYDEDMQLDGFIPFGQINIELPSNNFETFSIKESKRAIKRPLAKAVESKQNISFKKKVKSQLYDDIIDDNYDFNHAKISQNSEDNGSSTSSRSSSKSRSFSEANSNSNNNINGKSLNFSMQELFNEINKTFSYGVPVQWDMFVKVSQRLLLLKSEQISLHSTEFKENNLHDVVEQTNNEIYLLSTLKDQLEVKMIRLLAYSYNLPRNVGG